MGLCSFTNEIVLMNVTLLYFVTLVCILIAGTADESYCTAS